MRAATCWWDKKINVPLNDVKSLTTSSAKASPVKAEPQFKVESYKVQRGDTLYSIASQSKMSLSELADLNNLSTNSGLQVGQSIRSLRVQACQILIPFSQETH